jgi:hypothetical protein
MVARRRFDHAAPAKRPLHSVDANARHSAADCRPLAALDSAPRASRTRARRKRSCWSACACARRQAELERRAFRFVRASAGLCPSRAPKTTVLRGSSRRCSGGNGRKSRDRACRPRCRRRDSRRRHPSESRASTPPRRITSAPAPDAACSYAARMSFAIAAIGRPAHAPSGG